MNAIKELEELRATMEQRIVDKVRLILRAEKVAPGISINAGWSDEMIRAKAVAEKMGPAAIDGKSTEYIEARFDHFADQVPVDPVRLALASRADRSH